MIFLMIYDPLVCTAKKDLEKQETTEELTVERKERLQTKVPDVIMRLGFVITAYEQIRKEEVRLIS
jgi:hypothetical protein